MSTIILGTSLGRSKQSCVNWYEMQGVSGRKFSSKFCHNSRYNEDSRQVEFPLACFSRRIPSGTDARPRAGFWLSAKPSKIGVRWRHNENPAEGGRRSVFFGRVEVGRV